MPTAKDWSEIIKNLVSAAAVITGGWWVLYQWNTIFPKTRADVQSAAAMVRTDVSGEFTVQLGLEDEELEFRDERSASEPIGLQEYCGDNANASLIQTSSVFGQLQLRSASAIPVRARVERIRVATVPINPGFIAPQAEPIGAARARPPIAVAAVDSEDMFFGGLRENRVERGQEVQVAVMFDVDVPVHCTQLGPVDISR
jgi:hypothetical protein